MDWFDVCWFGSGQFGFVCFNIGRFGIGLISSGGFVIGIGIGYFGLGRRVMVGLCLIFVCFKTGSMIRMIELSEETYCCVDWFS